METVLAMWTLRLALIAAAAVAMVSYSVGTSPIDALDRGLVAAIAFTIAGQWLLDRIESPDARIRRLRAKRAGKRAKPAKKSPARGQPKGVAA